MAPVLLSQSAAVTLDGTGAGTARLGPASMWETWSPGIVSVKTNQAPGSIVNEAQCRIYAGSDASPPNFVDQTLSGSSGDSSDSLSGQVVNCGQYVWAVWTGGDAGAQGFVNVTGTKTVGGT